MIKKILHFARIFFLCILEKLIRKKGLVSILKIWYDSTILRSRKVEEIEMKNQYFMKGLAHIGIYTSNPKECADFYVEHLGFHSYHMEQRENFVIYFVENQGCIIEFVEKEGFQGKGAIHHIALEVQGIEALAKELAQKGIVPKDYQIKKLEPFFAASIKNLFFTGPAGEVIELFDYTNV